MLEQCRSHLSGAKFRSINEMLYKSTGGEALEFMQNDATAFDEYHRGYAEQMSHWPADPLQRIVSWLKRRPASKIVADFGCGDARLAASVPNRVHSFDLVALNARVTACDMAHVPLRDESVDVCVFCLSLMGTNIADYLVEARRVLRAGGSLRIIEVASRFVRIKRFLRQVARIGFEAEKVNKLHDYFLELYFVRASNEAIRSSAELPNIHLKACAYKKR